MDANLYQEQILDRYHHPRHQGIIEDAAKHEGANRTCGDEITIYLRTDAGVITDLRFESRACAICTASADLLADRLISQPETEIAQITPKEVQKMLGIPLSPIRLKCALLPLETLKTQR
jgi:nitrogen fixation NifU-like protein